MWCSLATRGPPQWRAHSVTALTHLFSSPLPLSNSLSGSESNLGSTVSSWQYIKKVMSLRAIGQFCMIKMTFKNMNSLGPPFPSYLCNHKVGSQVSHSLFWMSTSRYSYNEINLINSSKEILFKEGKERRAPCIVQCWAQLLNNTCQMPASLPPFHCPALTATATTLTIHSPMHCLLHGSRGSTASHVSFHCRCISDIRQLCSLTMINTPNPHFSPCSNIWTARPWTALCPCVSHKETLTLLCNHRFSPETLNLEFKKDTLFMVEPRQHKPVMRECRV